MSRQVVFGYRHINWPGFKKCPCNDPGNYCMMEVDGVIDKLRCWCGRWVTLTFDSPEERKQFIEAHERVQS